MAGEDDLLGCLHDYICCLQFHGDAVDGGGLRMWRKMMHCEDGDVVVTLLAPMEEERRHCWLSFCSYCVADVAVDDPCGKKCKHRCHTCKAVHQSESSCAA